MAHPSKTDTTPAEPAASHASVEGHVHLHDRFEVSGWARHGSGRLRRGAKAPRPVG
jgi:hypothetical protein